MYLFACLLITSALSVKADQGPPKIYFQPLKKTIYFKPGEVTDLLCVADGSPKPTYTWQINGRSLNITGTSRLTQVPDEGTLVFKNPIPTDEGIYQCFASNVYGVSASVKMEFREAILGSFRQEDTQTHAVRAGDSLTLNCVPPVNYPGSAVMWAIKDPYVDWQRLEFSKRVSMDHEGRLRFTNVKKSDERGGQPYACMAVNTFLRNVSIGPEHILQVFGGSEVSKTASIMWASPADMFFLKDDSMTLGCIFSGSPTPDVSWERTDGDKMLPANRTELKQFGQELWIHDLQLSDIGQYQCTGVNNESMNIPARSFNVRIESRPYWVDEPEDVSANEGENATFVCRADGVPKPIIRWYINGVPITSSSDPRIKSERFNSPNSNTITMTDLNVKDSMNIQCNASNKHDYIWADVYLNITGSVSAASHKYDGSIVTIFIGIICIMASN